MTDQSRPLTVAAAQLVSGPDPVANLEQVRRYAAQAAAAGAGLVVFPEATMACFGTRLREVAEPLHGRFADGVRAVAAELGVVLVVGMFEPAPDGRVYNTLLATGPGLRGPDGAGEAAYRKIHLFDAFGSLESAVVCPGSDLVTATISAPDAVGSDASAVVVGLATCYDVRFADQFTALGRAGAELICLPASWGDGPGKAAQWDLLTRARAMDAQAWVLACGQAWVPGQGSNPLGIGRSVAADPLGRVRAQLGHEPGLLVTSIDLGLVAPIRARIPIL